MTLPTWLLDFDDTLATGSMTWTIHAAVPKLVRQHELPYDAHKLADMMLVMQERIAHTPDIQLLLAELFDGMRWPYRLQEEFLDDLLTNYQSTLYEDVVPFLERLRAQGHRVFIVSNNQRTPDNVQLLGIDGYVDRVYTPRNSPGTRSKPHASIWHYIIHEVDIDPSVTVVVGDDPWSDGAFADACDLPCWIVDRMDRFTPSRRNLNYHWVSSLADIPV